MAKTAILLATVLTLLGLLTVFKATQSTKPEEVTMVNPFTSDCTKQLALECALDIESTVRACAAAFETQGANIIADIKCAKDLLADKKHCWPCICFEAEKKGWKIIGC